MKSSLVDTNNKLAIISSILAISVSALTLFNIKAVDEFIDNNTFVATLIMLTLGIFIGYFNRIKKPNVNTDNCLMSNSEIIEIERSANVVWIISYGLKHDITNSDFIESIKINLDKGAEYRYILKDTLENRESVKTFQKIYGISDEKLKDTFRYIKDNPLFSFFSAVSIYNPRQKGTKAFTVGIQTGKTGFSAVAINEKEVYDYVYNYDHLWKSLEEENQINKKNNKEEYDTIISDKELMQIERDSKVIWILTKRLHYDINHPDFIETIQLNLNNDVEYRYIIEDSSENKDLVKRFQKKYQVSDKEIENIFRYTDENYLFNFIDSICIYNPRKNNNRAFILIDDNIDGQAFSNLTISDTRVYEYVNAFDHLWHKLKVN